MTTWPALMRPATACAYLDLSADAFRRAVAAEVPAVLIGARRHFRRADLDAWLARRGTDGQAAATVNWLEVLDHGRSRNTGRQTRPGQEP
jgi:excisionase family DNA binding protein